MDGGALEMTAFSDSHVVCKQERPRDAEQRRQVLRRLTVSSTCRTHTTCKLGQPVTALIRDSYLTENSVILVRFNQPRGLEMETVAQDVQFQKCPRARSRVGNDDSSHAPRIRVMLRLG
jgi:hypothetical protein